MKSLFKKYYNSVSNPEEFEKITYFISDKKNESKIFSLMSPFWDKELKNTEVKRIENPALLKRIKDNIRAEKQKVLQRKINLYAWGIRVAAVLVVALLISNFFFYQNSNKNLLSKQLQTISTPIGAKTNITLPDGSNVWLNAGSTISYPLSFDKTRPVTLEGEAYFDVVNTEKPFIVSTDYGIVEVLGTSFNVMAYNDDSFETTLVEGIVAFTVSGTEDRVTLKPGEQIAKSENRYTIKTVETKYFTSWTEGKLIFNREPFPSFIKKLERWYNVKIVYQDRELDKLWYTGTIEMESISEVMEMISKATSVSYSFDNKTRVFTIKAK